MAPASNEEQFKFLISCIRYSNNGKVDFGQVAKECKIVSKGAAAKRYERMMKSHGIASNAATIKPAPSRSSNMKSECREPGSSSIKKRKTDAFLNDTNTVDDDEAGYATNIKAENCGSGKEHFVVKEEEEQVGQRSLNDAANLMQYYDSPVAYVVGSGAGEGHTDAEETCGGSEGNSGYASSSMSNTYSMRSSQPYNFPMTYGSMAMSTPRLSESQSMSFQEMAPYSTTNQGRLDSTVVVLE